AGIEDEKVLETCVLDFGLTGEIGFVRSAATAEVAQLLVDGTLDPDAMPIGGDDGERESVETELTVEPYEPESDEIAWLFDGDGDGDGDGADPDQVPEGVEVTSIENPNDIGIFEVTDDYGYPTDPILRVGTGATTPEEAIELGSFVEFEVTPTVGPVEVTGVQLAVGRGRSGETRRGIDLRSSADDYASSLLTTDIDVTRPDMERFSTSVHNLTITEPTTFRLHVYTGGVSHTVEFGDLAISISR